MSTLAATRSSRAEQSTRRLKHADHDPAWTADHGAVSLSLLFDPGILAHGADGCPALSAAASFRRSSHWRAIPLRLTTSGQFIRTSLIYGLGTVLVTMLIATPAAYALARIRSRIGLFLLIALILAQMAPGFVVANSLYAMFSRLKLINILYRRHPRRLDWRRALCHYHHAGVYVEHPNRAVRGSAGGWRRALRRSSGLSSCRSAVQRLSRRRCSRSWLAGGIFSLRSPSPTAPI